MKLQSVLLLVFFSFIFLNQTTLAQDAAKNSTWRELKLPNKEKSVFLEPQLLSVGSRIHMVWSGTNKSIRSPEVFHSFLDGKSEKWRAPRAPFFGKNKGRVRKIKLGRTRDLIGIMFQRSLKQGNDAYEVLLALSGDQGWEWSNTIEIDSFVAEKTGGTALAIAGRQGTNRPEFSLAWGREFGNIRTANFDTKSNLRPEGSAIGKYPPTAEKIEIGTLGRPGFSVIYNNGGGLSSSHVRALVGKISEGKTFLRGQVEAFFTVASRPNGSSRMAVAIGNTLEALTSKGKEWKKDDSQSTTLPFPNKGVSVESDVDGKKNLHLALLRKTPGKNELWYLGQKNKVWGKAELLHSFDDKVDMRGFDIAVSKKVIVIVASQGFQGKVFQKEL